MEYRKNLFNKKSQVMFENKSDNKNKFFGRDEYLNSVIVETKENLIGKFKEVLITSGNHTTLYGDISSNVKSRGNFAA